MSEREEGLLAAIRAWNSRRLERRRRRRAGKATLETIRGQVASLGAAVERLGTQVDALIADDEVVLGALTRLLSEFRMDRDARAAGRGGAPAGPGGGADTWPVIATSRTKLLEPELNLLAHLAPALEPRVAIDVGAHHGRFAEALLDLGFEVHALEPNPEACDVLVQRLGGRPGLKVHRAAAGAEDGEAELGLVANPAGDYTDATQFASLSGLPLPEGLVRKGTVKVPVTRLDSLVREQRISPPTLVKVDAEGFDLEVLRGLGALEPAVQLVEFWDDELPFSAPGAKNRLPDLVAHAREHGAAWHLVVFRRWGDDRPAFYRGLCDSPERAWGNVIFFRDRALFEQARTVLSGIIPEAQFTPNAPAHEA